MAERKLLGQNLTQEERIHLAHLAAQPGWQILIKLMAESCRTATEEVIKLPNTVERYPEVLVGLQTTARAMNKFSNDVLDSVRVHISTASQQVKEDQKPDERAIRFKGFGPPQPQSEKQNPIEGEQ
jgi:hypothetical protein